MGLWNKQNLRSLKDRISNSVSIVPQKSSSESRQDHEHTGVASVRKTIKEPQTTEEPKYSSLYREESIQNISDLYSPASRLDSIYAAHRLTRPNTTRVLEVLPSSSSSDSLACRLRVICLDSPPDYRALSYVWGDPCSTEFILVDHKPFEVRVNLWHMLNQMRVDCYTGHLWIDAICINQTDLGERSKQVAIMSQIYSKALDVRAWLGPGTDHSLSGMRTLAGTDWKEEYSALQHIRRQQRRPSVITGDGLEATEEVRQVTVTDKRIASITEILGSEYWSRLWIIQEYSLARTVAIQCGPITVSDTTLGDVQLFLKDVENYLYDYGTIQQATGALSLTYLGVSTPLNSMAFEIRSIRRIRALQIFTDEVYFAYLLCTSSESRCVVAHDRVYALLAMSAAVSQKIAPDYTISLSQLFEDVLAMFKETYDRGNEHETRKILLAIGCLKECWVLDEECLKVQRAMMW